MSFGKGKKKDKESKCSITHSTEAADDDVLVKPMLCIRTLVYLALLVVVCFRSSPRLRISHGPHEQQANVGSPNYAVALAMYSRWRRA